ncbi:hypothetical protein QOT17_013767 [Balamuthia mandrillaris]
MSDFKKQSPGTDFGTHQTHGNFYSRNKEGIFVNAEKPQIVRWQPKAESAKDRPTPMFIICEHGMPEKWRRDRTIPLVDVVQRFKIYRGQTPQDDADQPTKEELKEEFGTDKQEDVIMKILEEGDILFK